MVDQTLNDQATTGAIAPTDFIQVSRLGVDTKELVSDIPFFIVNNTISNAKLVQMAANTIKGNNTGGALSPIDLTVAQTKILLALENVDNTSDISKPISTATATALDGKKNDFFNNTAFNKNFGSIAGSVTEGNDSRLSDSRTCDNTFDNVPTAKINLGLENVDNTSDTDKPISTATATALDGKVDENGAIIGATKTKITYDAKGLVTAGVDATTNDIAEFLNKRYVTDADLLTIGVALVPTDIGSTVQGFDANTVKKNLVQLYTKQQNFGGTTLSDAANISWDLDNHQSSRVTPTGARVLNNPTNMLGGGTYILRVIGTGSLTFGSAYDFGTSGAPIFTSTAGKYDILTFISTGSKMAGSFKGGFTL